MTGEDELRTVESDEEKAKTAADRAEAQPASNDIPIDRPSYRVATVESFESGDRAFVEVDGIEVVVFYLDEEFHALLNYCPHQGGPIGEGSVSGTLDATRKDGSWVPEYDDDINVVACPWHGWEFDVETGEQLADSSCRLPCFDVTVLDGVVYVTL